MEDFRIRMRLEVSPSKKGTTQDLFDSTSVGGPLGRVHQALPSNYAPPTRVHGNGANFVVSVGILDRVLLQFSHILATPFQSLFETSLTE